MLYRLRRHPVPVTAHFDHCLVLAYAVPAPVLRPLLPPGLTLDQYGDWGFLAVALVQTRGLRPRFLPPALGQRFFLSGYRIFARHRGPRGIERRGLRILRSDTDRRLMACAGNLLTHYNYRRAAVRVTATPDRLEVRTRTPGGAADLHVVADLGSRPAPLPAGSPFRSMAEAKRFAGPLPWTFDYEPETHALIQIKGERSTWRPEPVGVDVRENTFLAQPPFAGRGAVLANAFYLHDLDYTWHKGQRAALRTPAA